MTEHTFALPESFVPEEFLTSPKLWRRQDDARYFISLILTKTARRDVDERGLVRLHAKHLESIMYQETYSKVIAALRLGGAVERFPYQVGEKSFGFRLSARFVGDKHVRVPATDRRLIARLNAFHAQAAVERDSRMKPGESLPSCRVPAIRSTFRGRSFQILNVGSFIATSAGTGGSPTTSRV